MESHQLRLASQVMKEFTRAHGVELDLLNALQWSRQFNRCWLFLQHRLGSEGYIYNRVIVAKRLQGSNCNRGSIPRSIPVSVIFWVLSVLPEVFPSSFPFLGGVYIPFILGTLSNTLGPLSMEGLNQDSWRLVLSFVCWAIFSLFVFIKQSHQFPLL